MVIEKSKERYESRHELRRGREKRKGGKKVGYYMCTYKIMIKSGHCEEMTAQGGP